MMNSPRLRRRFAAFLLAWSALFMSSLAWAGSYLDRAALLLDEARREGDMLLPRTYDKEMVLVVKALTEARAKVSRQMEVPAPVAKAHPHLLLVLANYERAADAAAEGNFKKFVEHLNMARDEDRTFRAVLAELSYTLPDLNPKR
jgi:recombinational DNA repair ATPase RecF